MGHAALVMRQGPWHCVPRVPVRPGLPSMSGPWGQAAHGEDLCPVLEGLLV